MNFNAHLYQCYPTIIERLPQLKAVVFDRDGTLNVSAPARDATNTGYVLSYDDFRFSDGVIAALQQMERAGLAFHIFTQQSAIGKGLLSEDGLAGIHQKMCADLATYGIVFGEIVYCPHSRDDSGQLSCLREGSPCAKTSPDKTPENYQGMLGEIMNRTGLTPPQILVIGDSPRDIPPAWMTARGMLFIGVANPEKPAEANKIRRYGFPVAENLAQIADFVTGQL